MSTAVRTPPHHDTLTCFKDYGCRLPACHERYLAYERERYRRRTEGQIDLVDAARVRAHVRALYAAEFTDYRIAVLADVSPPTIHALGQRPYAKDRGQQRRINAEIAEKILAIDPATHRPGRLPADGTRRRLQALVTLGWPISEIGARAGLSAHNADRILRRPVLNVSTVEAVAGAYDVLRQLKPERSGVAPGSAKRARNHARSRRWAPPAYWDHSDHPIDDPGFRSDYGVSELQILAEDAAWLMKVTGLNRAGVAKRLGKSHSYIDKALSTHPQDGQVAA